MNLRNLFRPSAQLALLLILFPALFPPPSQANEGNMPPLTQLERKTPSWLTHAIFYQIYPQSFYDSNGDGIGDLPGITAKLDYIASLGVNAIWLNPFYDSPFGDAGYDIRDYTKVAARYGSNKDAKKLFTEAHKRGIHVLLDLVAGHTSIEHPWFQDSLQSDHSPHANWYIWTPGNAHEKKLVQSPGPRSGKYKKNFFNFQAALNYGYGSLDPAKPWQRPPSDPNCIAVRNAMRDVMQYWLEMGCDGFRVDMASSLIKEDPSGEGIRKLWSYYRGWLNQNYPEAILVSEWGEPDKAIPAGFNVDFLLPIGNKAYSYLLNPLLGKKIRNTSFFNRDGRGDIQKFLKEYLPQYEQTKQLGFIALPSGNHDFSRPRFQGREIPDLKVIYTMLFTMPGVPFLYYGDEIGMRNLKNWPHKEGAMWRGSCRSPMQWEPGTKAGFSTGSPSTFYLPLDPDPRRPDVATEAKDPESLLNFTKTLFKLRQTYPSLGNLGGFKPLYAESKKFPFVYARSGGDVNFIIALNPSKSSQTCTLVDFRNSKFILNAGASLKDDTLSMPPVSYAILKMTSPKERNQKSN